MIEWTVCSECKSVLEINAETCPYCGGCVEKYNLNDLKKFITDFNFIINSASVVSALSPDLASINFETLILDDLFQWFSYLGLGDGVITDLELEFINTLLDTNYLKEDLIKLTDLKLTNTLPDSFVYLKKLDDFSTSFGLGDVDSTSAFYEIFRLLGAFLISIDADVNDDVLELYTSYMKFLKSSLGVNITQKNTLTKAKDNLKENIPETPEEEDDSKSLDDYLDELNKLVGLSNVKKDVNSLINLVRIRKLRDERGICQPAMSLHLVFSGNPGTGKTTVARLLSKIYKEIGVLSQGHLIETDRSGLVGGYVGQTAIKTQEVIQSAMGGILFIDEAYALAGKSENDYGTEAIDTILKAMEDKRDDFIVIVAGYTELMDQFLGSNPGLESRFNKFLHFDDYDAGELYDIFMLMCEGSNLVLDEAADKYAHEYFTKMYETRKSNFANGRSVRNFFEEVIVNQANRLALKEDISDDELNTLTYEDFLVE